MDPGIRASGTSEGKPASALQPQASAEREVSVEGSSKDLEALQ